VLNVIFMYRLTVATGAFATLQQAIGGVTADRRLQLLLIAFSFGAFFDGASGFGTPVAVTAAILIGLGFSPLAASGLSLIANTAPVAYGALGTPIAGLASVTGLDPYLLGAIVGRQLPFFSLIVPAWLICAFAGWRGMVQIWPAILVCGLSFAIPQYLISNFINPWIVDISASLIWMVCLIGFLRFWHPTELWTSPALRSHDDSSATMPPPRAPGPEPTRRQVWWSLMPWIIVCVVLLIWGTGVQGAGQPDLHLELRRGRAAQHRAEGAASGRQADTRGCRLRLHLSVLHRQRHADCRHHLWFCDGLFTGTDDQSLWRDIRVVSYSLITISAILAIGTLTRFSGIDATLGLAFAGAGVLYPFFGTLLGWLGLP
jgi:lactate permease